MSGKYSYLLGQQGNPLFNWMTSGLSEEHKLLPEYLKEKGYATHALGKWGLGFCKPEYLPTNRGFDSHYGYWTNQETYYSHDTNGYDFHEGIENDFTANNTYSEELFADRVAEIIDDHVANKPEKPFFIYMAHQATHTPLDPPAKYLEMYPDIKDDQRRRFFATASIMDEKVGLAVEKLKDVGVYNNTIIIWMSDNGANPNRGGGSNWPLRGMKGIVYEGGIRTPAFVHSPLLNASNITNNHIMHLTDWLPSLLHVVGASQQEITAQNFSGQNRWSLLKDPSLPDPRTEVVHEINLWDNTTVGALRQGRYKLVKIYGFIDWGWMPPSEQDNQHKHVQGMNENLDSQLTNPLRVRLFDIEADPEERTPLNEDFPEVLAAMSARMDELGVDMVPTQTGQFSTDGVVDGVWRTGWC